MSVDFQLVDAIGDSDKLMISRYLQSLNKSSFDVPPLVYNLCVLYWMQSDYLQIHGDHIHINNEDEESDVICIATVVDNHDSEFAEDDMHQFLECVYGDFDINDDNPNAVYQWVFKIGKNECSNTSIGICTTTQYRNTWYTDFIDKDSEEDFYSFGYEVKFTKNGWGEKEYPELKEGDTVVMECDINAQTLTFKVNEDSRVAIFDGIDYSRTYKLAILLCDEGDSVKLISFKRWIPAQK